MARRDIRLSTKSGRFNGRYWLDDLFMNRWALVGALFMVLSDSLLVAVVLSLLVPSAQVALIVVTDVSVSCPVSLVESATVISDTVRFRDSS